MGRATAASKFDSPVVPSTGRRRSETSEVNQGRNDIGVPPREAVSVARRGRAVVDLMRSDEVINSGLAGMDARRNPHSPARPKHYLTNCAYRVGQHGWLLIRLPNQHLGK